MTKTPKDYNKIISVLFCKAYVGLKSISCITFISGLVVSLGASQSEGPGFESHAILFKKKKKDIFILQWRKSIGNHFIWM